MRWIPACLALAIAPLFANPPAANLAPTAIYSHFQQIPSSVVLEAMQEEVSSIMAPIGMPLEWRSLDDAESGEVAVELAVVTFKGNCTTASLPTHPATSGPLGWTHVSDGVILPFADVDCDGTRNFIGRSLAASFSASDRDIAFGKALGRILAHELYHIFANTVHHGLEGVGKPAYSVRELLSPDFRFDESETDTLINSKAHDALERAGAVQHPDQ